MVLLGVKMAKAEKKPCQDEMKKDDGGGSQPPSLRIKCHGNSVSKDHGNEVEIAEPAQQHPQPCPRNNRQPVLSRKVNADFDLHYKNQALEKKENRIGD
jgi:hypothetical protein